MAIDYVGTIYPGSGQSKAAKDSGQTTRHYASDGSSPTHDWEVTGNSWKDYEATCVQNIPADELSIKVWGPGHRVVTYNCNRYQRGMMGLAAGIFSK